MSTGLSLFIIINVLCFVAFIIYAKKRAVLPAVVLLIAYIAILGIGLMLIKLAEAGRIPAGFLWIGAFMMIGVGARFVVAGVQKKVDLDKSLLKLNSLPFNFDRLLFEKYGGTYFYVRSIIIGVGFILFGAITLLRRSVFHN